MIIGVTKPFALNNQLNRLAEDLILLLLKID